MLRDGISLRNQPFGEQQEIPIEVYRLLERSDDLGLSVRPSALGGYRRGVVTRILTVEDVFELGTYHRLSARRGA